MLSTIFFGKFYAVLKKLVSFENLKKKLISKTTLNFILLRKIFRKKLLITLAPGLQVKNSLTRTCVVFKIVFERNSFSLKPSGMLTNSFPPLAQKFSGSSLAGDKRFTIRNNVIILIISLHNRF